MNDDLAFESASTATLRMLLAQERAARQELEQELARLRAGLQRQNERIIQLEQTKAAAQKELLETRLLVAAQGEQNEMLRQRIVAIQQENEQLRGVERTPKRPAQAWSNERTKQEPPAREERTRKTRDRKHNHGRQRMSRVNETVRHAASSCPRCGSMLIGGWVHRRTQLIDLPAPAHAIVTEHQVIARRCPACRGRVLPPQPPVIPGRIGRCRFGPRLLATIATWFTVERLPGRMIQERLRREYDLSLSHGGIIGLLQLVARLSTSAYQQLQVHVRGSPVVHMDETAWKEDGVPGSRGLDSLHPYLLLPPLRYPSHRSGGRYHPGCGLCRHHHL